LEDIAKSAESAWISTKAALIEYCGMTLKKRDIPEIIQVLGEIPKTISEKPIERICIERLREVACRSIFPGCRWVEPFAQCATLSARHQRAHNVAGYRSLE
jgi:hypothetical protein